MSGLIIQDRNCHMNAALILLFVCVAPAASLNLRSGGGGRGGVRGAANRKRITPVGGIMAAVRKTATNSNGHVVQLLVCR